MDKTIVFVNLELFFVLFPITVVTSSINQITTFTWYNKTMYYKKDLVLPKKKKKKSKIYNICQWSKIGYGRFIKSTNLILSQNNCKTSKRLTLL